LFCIFNSPRGHEDTKKITNNQETITKKGHKAQERKEQVRNA